MSPPPIPVPTPLARQALVLAALWGLAAPAVAGTVQVRVLGATGQPLPQAAVLLEPAGDARAAVKPATAVEIVQQGRRFVPELTVVPVGTAVHFPNMDTVRHHVYSFSPAKRFELKLYAGRPEHPVVFDRPGIVVLGCNIHDQMVGWVVVADTPWHGRTDAAGTVTLDAVPPGRYTLRAWHPALAPGAALPEQAVTVGAGPLELSVPLGVAAR
ncbi:methylamine utilization protein [Ideonella sp.]|uniref:methylamine utilization protein n=1 Tax=Ideonella sp. TaxID=1929293 RepID=UPI0035B4AE5A